MGPGFDGFFRDSYPDVVAALSLSLGSRHLAEEAAQHGFYQALRRWHRVRTMINPIGWVYVVALRQALRQTHPKEFAAGLAGTDGSIGDNDAERVIDRQLLRDAVAELTPRQRTVFVCRHLIGLSAVETAQTLGVQAGTVRALDHQARSRLKNCLSAVEDLEVLDAT